jgi:hypothetical protein
METTAPGGGRKVRRIIGRSAWLGWLVPCSTWGTRRGAVRVFSTLVAPGRGLRLAPRVAWANRQGGLSKNSDMEKCPGPGVLSLMARIVGGGRKRQGSITCGPRGASQASDSKDQKWSTAIMAVRRRWTAGHVRAEGPVETPLPGVTASRGFESTKGRASMAGGGGTDW